MSLRSTIKGVANAAALALVSPCALTCWIESRLSAHAEGVFGFWTNVMATLPGAPGMYLRRAFYRLSLDSCSLDCYLGFGMLFTHREAIVEDRAYVGPYCLIGSAHLHRDCLLASRVSVLSGSALHAMDADGRWLAADLSKLRQIDVGENAWVGEGAIVLHDVGRGSLVGAGSVVSRDVPPGVVAVGNPARIIRELRGAPGGSDSK